MGTIGTLEIRDNVIADNAGGLDLRNAGGVRAIVSRNRIERNGTSIVASSWGSTFTDYVITDNIITGNRGPVRFVVPGTIDLRRNVISDNHNPPTTSARATRPAHLIEIRDAVRALEGGECYPRPAATAPCAYAVTAGALPAGPARPPTER